MNTDSLVFSNDSPTHNSTMKLIKKATKKTPKWRKLTRTFKKDYLGVHTYLNLILFLMIIIIGMQTAILVKKNNDTEKRIDRLQYLMHLKADAMSADILSNIANRSIAFNKSLVDDREKRSVDVLSYSSSLTDFKLALTRLTQTLSMAKVLLPACEKDSNF